MADDSLETRLAHKRLFADFLSWEDADGCDWGCSNSGGGNSALACAQRVQACPPVLTRTARLLQRAYCIFRSWRLPDQIRDELADRDRKTNNVLRLSGCRVDVQNYRLRAWNATVQRQLLEHPTEYLPGLQDAVREHVAASEELAPALAAVGADAAEELLVGVRGEFGDLELSPRELGSSHLGRLVKVYGIVTRCSLVRPKLVRSVHYCPDTGATLTREYRDVTALTGLPTGAT